MSPADLVSGEVCVQQVAPGEEVAGGGRQAHYGAGRRIIIGVGVRAPGRPHARRCLAKRRPGIGHGQFPGIRQVTRVALVCCGERVGAVGHHGGKAA
jgi:hypothetical protein